jgi:hypothetical protein
VEGEREADRKRQAAKEAVQRPRSATRQCARWESRAEMTMEEQRKQEDDEDGRGGEEERRLEAKNSVRVRLA